MTRKVVVFLALAVYQVTAQCCGPRPVQVQQQLVNPYPAANQFVPNIVTNLPAVATNIPGVVTNYPQLVKLPAPVVKNPCNQVVQVPTCANQAVPIVPSAVFATTLVDNSVANSLANALQLLIVSDLIESTINGKDCRAPILEAVDVDCPSSYPYKPLVDLCPDLPPLTAQLTLGYNIPVAFNGDGCGCGGPCGCSSKYYF